MIGNICVFIAVPAFIRGRLREIRELRGEVGERGGRKPSEECVRALPNFRNNG